MPGLNVRLIYGGRTLQKVQAVSDVEYRHEAIGVHEKEMVCMVLLASVLRLDERYALSVFCRHGEEEVLVASLRTQASPSGDSVFFAIPEYRTPLSAAGGNVQITVRILPKDQAADVIAPAASATVKSALSSNSEELGRFGQSITWKCFHFFESFATSRDTSDGRLHSFSESIMEQMVPKFLVKIQDSRLGWAQFAS